MNIKTFSEGLLGSNTYVVWDENSLKGMIIDCGNEPRTVERFCNSHGITVEYIVITHGHYDHADFIKAYKSIFPSAKTVCHKDERAVLSDPEANVSELVGASCTYPMPDMTVEEGDTLRLGCCSGIEFTVLHTPGHTPGGICLLCEKEKIMFTGDTLFAGGYGRTDFKYGSATELIASLRRLSSMDGDITFYSGHGDAGMLKNERSYLNGE